MEKIIFFDLDGTVLDTQQDIADCMNMALADLGYEQRSYEDYRKVIGNDAPNFVRKLLGDMPYEKLMSIWDYYTTFVHKFGTEKTKVFDGVKEALAVLKQRGYKLVAYTNKTPEENIPFEEKFLQDLNFDLIVAVGGTEDAKPSATGVEKVLSKFGVLPENAYLVGDGETDVMTAINAKVNCVAVLWGNRDKEFLAQYGAKVFASTPSELLDIIK
jgi:phosphoglycolate phosphatase